MADSDNEGAGGGSGTGNPSGNEMSPREQDRFLPIANVSRIMKKALPANAKISKEAKETVQECVSEFISFVTGEASDKCQKEKRKTINGDDLLWAMTTLGFEEYMDPLKVYLQRFRESEGEKSMSVHDRDGPGGASSSSTTGLRNGDGFEGSGSGGVYGNSMVLQGPHVYGSSGFHHMAVGGSTGMGFGGLGKTGPGYAGPGSNSSRPK